MRVLHVLHTSLPYICGYSIRTDYILRFQREQGLIPAAVTSAQHPNGTVLREEIQGFTHWRTPARAGRQTPLLREWQLMRSLRARVDEAIREWKPDLIHAHSPMLVGYPALQAARKFGLPFVYEVRDLWENASVDRGKFSDTSVLYRMTRNFESHVLRQADAVVTICENLRSELAPRSGGADKLFVVGNGVDTSSFKSASANPELRARWSLGGKQVIGYIGTFQPYEGLDTLIAAVPQIVQEHPNAHVVITGSGGQEEHLKSLVRAGSLERHVTFTGRLPHDQVAGMYALADVLVYPRILTRTTALTTPLKPLEAMAMGKTVIMSDVPAMLELVAPDHTGMVFRAGDAGHLAAQCVRALRHPAEREAFGQAAQQWVRDERQWPHLVSRYQQVYRRACGARSGCTNRVEAPCA